MTEIRKHTESIIINYNINTIFFQVIKARFGSRTHQVFCLFAFFTNLIVMMSLTIAGTTVLNSLVKVRSMSQWGKIPWKKEQVCRGRKRTLITRSVTWGCTSMPHAAGTGIICTSASTTLSRF